jgi:hypothetical protein
MVESQQTPSEGVLNIVHSSCRLGSDMVTRPIVEKSSLHSFTACNALPLRMTRIPRCTDGMQLPAEPYRSATHLNSNLDEGDDSLQAIRRSHVPEHKA